MSLWDLRLRALLHQQFAVAASVLVVLALVGGFATYTAHVEPGTTTEERVVSTWETTGSFDHSATVVEENPVFPVDSELENRSVYFARLAPILDGTYVFGYSATGGGSEELTAEIDLALVTRSAESGDQSENVLWETRRQLDETRTATLGSGESVRVPFSVNTSAVERRQSRIAEQLGTSTGSVQTAVQATVAVRGTVNGERIRDARTHTLPLTFETDVYRIGSVQEPTERTEVTQSVTVPREYGPLRSIGGPALLVCSLVGLAGLAVARSESRLDLTDAELEWLAYREDRSEFDEWITTFWLPPEVFDRPEAEAASLADLVDFAIDTGGGVVESPNGSEYYVVHGEFVYTYTAPQPPRRVRDAERESDAAPEADGDPTSGTDTEDNDSDSGTSDEGTDGDPDREAEGDSTAAGLDAAALDLGFEVSSEENGASDTVDERDQETADADSDSKTESNPNED
ncbi:DUF5305 domain-containing protein [Salinigranum sp. GCM10025319]|uniref:DUF5305 domain-containing protein n=1 Tax=Salinigranum sp. GCM10025319 TaxID=3252687 RepID=UPI0036072F0B